MQQPPAMQQQPVVAAPAVAPQQQQQQPQQPAQAAAAPAAAVAVAAPPAAASPSAGAAPPPQAQAQQHAAAAAAAAAQQQQQQQQQQPAKMSAMDQLLQYKQQLETDLVRVEQQIADMEHKFFLADHSATANVIKGFEAHLSSKEALRKRMQRSWRPEDRWFSLSSTTSPVTQELAEQQEAEAPLQGGFGKKGYPPAKSAYAQKGKR